MSGNLSIVRRIVIRYCVDGGPRQRQAWPIGGSAHKRRTLVGEERITSRHRSSFTKLKFSAPWATWLFSRCCTARLSWGWHESAWCAALTFHHPPKNVPA